MLKVTNPKVFNLEGAIRGMRFPMQSGDKADSTMDSSNVTIMVLNDGRKITTPENPSLTIGPKNLALARKLIAAGTDHSKFMRQILVSMDITAPLYW